MRIGTACLWASLFIAASLPIWAGPFSLGVLAIIAAIGMVFVLRDISTEDLAFLGSVARLPMIAMAAFVGFVLLQMFPAGPMAHPIWDSVSPALGRSVWGSVTVDTGMTFLGALAGGTLLALFALATAVGMARDRAKTMLYLLAALSCAVAALSLVAPLMGIDAETSAQARSAMPLCLVIAAGGIAGEVEAQLGQRSRGQGELRWPPRLVTLPLCAVGLGLSLGVGLATGSSFVAASAAGVLVMISPFIAVATRTGIWGILAIVLTAAVVGLALTSHLGSVAGPLPAGRGQAQVLDTATLMLQDAPLLGTGLGTFERMAEIYRLPGDSVLQPAGLIRLGIEIGPPMLLALVLLGLVAICVLLRGALMRGRGRVYPALGAGAGAALLVQMASSETVPGFLSAFLLALVGGLAFAQSKSRSKAL